jgi:hypothetical protein
MLQDGRFRLPNSWLSTVVPDDDDDSDASKDGKRYVRNS